MRSLLSYDGTTNDPNYNPSGQNSECFFHLELEDAIVEVGALKDSVIAKKSDEEFNTVTEVVAMEYPRARRGDL